MTAAIASDPGKLPRDRAVRIGLALVVVLAGVLPLLVTLVAHALLGDSRHVHEPLHELMEVAGSCFAVAVAMLLALRLRYEEKVSYLVWVVAALVVMGLIDGAHALAPFGPAWSWLRHGATLSGGVLFALVWWTRGGAAIRRLTGWVGLVVLAGLAGSAFFWLAAGSLPAPWSGGQFTMAVKVANALGGCGFLTATLFFLRRYWWSPEPADLVLGSHTLLFGISALAFGFSHVWGADWWAWHGFRLLAYVIILAAAYEMIVTLYQGLARQSRELEERVRLRTDDLNRQREWLRATLTSIGDGVIATDRDGRVTFVNRVAEAFTGWSEQEALGQPIGEICRLSDEVGAATQVVERALQAPDGAKRGNDTLTSREGRTAAVETRTVSMRDSGGHVLGAVLVLHDVTERRRMLEELAWSEAQLRATLEATADGILAVGLNGKVISANQRFAELWRVPDSLVARGDDETLLDFVLSQLSDPDGFLQRVRELYGTTEPSADTLLFKDGRVFERVSLPMLMDGILQGRVWSFRDVTERTQAETALRRIEWMLARPRGLDVQRTGQVYGDLTLLNTERTILDSVGRELLSDIVGDFMNLLETSSAVYEKNGDYAFGIFSSGWCQAMDLASFRNCGTTDNRRALACGKWSCHESCWNEASLRSMNGAQPADIECQGGIRLHAVPIFAGDEIVGSINFGYGDPPRDPGVLRVLAERYHLPIEELERNAANYQTRPPFIIELAKERLRASARLIGEIVQRKRAQQSLNELNLSLEARVRERTAELMAANQELESFSYAVSHDLRAPLRAMSGFSQAILEDYGPQLPEGVRPFLDQITHASQHMGRLVDGLLTLARSTRGPLVRDLVDVSAMVGRIRGQLEQGDPVRSVRWEVEPGLTLRGDPAMLEIAVTNLLRNAWKYTGRTPDATIRVYSAEEDGQRVFCITDNGAGFDILHAGKLFTPFKRLHRQDEFPGIGIGLATAQRILRRHGGTITATAAPGEGATFRLTLPGEDAAMQHEVGSGPEERT